MRRDGGADSLPAVVTTTSAVRVVNHRAVFDGVRARPAVSAAELVGTTGLSKPTVTAALTELERVGLIDQLGVRSGRLGRAPRLYRLRASAGAVLVADVGQTWTRIAAVDLAGGVLARVDRRSRRRSASGLVEQVHQQAGEALRAAGLSARDVTHTVLGSPGVFDPAADVIRLAPTLPGWGRPGLLEQVRRALPGPLSIENDVNLAALAELAELEHETGPAPDFVLLAAGTGLGLGVVLGGVLRRGAHGAAGELSSFPLLGSSSARGGDTLETLTAPASLVSQARRGGLASVRTPEDVFDAARAGSRAARRAVQTEAERLAAALAGVVAVVDPESVILGGGIGRNGDLLLEPITAALAAALPTPPPRIRVSALDADATVRGAIALGLDRACDAVFTAAVGP